VAELRLAFDRPQDFLPRFVEPAKLSQADTEVAPNYPFTGLIADFDILVRCLTEKCDGFLGSAQRIVPLLTQV
jgi:hypothetical protein